MFSFGPTGHQSIIRDLTNAALGLHQAAGLTLPPPYGAGSRLNVTRKLCVNKATAARLRETIRAAEKQTKVEQPATLAQQWVNLQKREKALKNAVPSEMLQGLPLSLSPLSIAETVATSPAATKAVTSIASSVMNRLTRKNQKLTPAQTLAKTKSAMLRLAKPTATVTNEREEGRQSATDVAVRGVYTAIQSYLRKQGVSEDTLRQKLQLIDGRIQLSDDLKALLPEAQRSRYNAAMRRVTQRAPKGLVTVASETGLPYNIL